MGRLMSGVLLMTMALSVATLCGATEPEILSTLADQSEVRVTIYNENLALVKDKRRLILPAGVADLAFREVSGRMRPETALMRGIGPRSTLTVLEQNFDFDLLTPQKMLEKFVGRQVGIVKTHPTTGTETIEEATVLSANSGVVLRVGDRIETGVPGRLVFSDVPANLRERPTLVMKVASDSAGPQEVELSYLTGGLGWQADYVAELDQNDRQLALNGWVTLTNTSGTTYRNARLQLMAGDVNQVRPAMVRDYKGKADQVMAMAAPAMAEESLFEYHLYSLERPTSIMENQTKQVALLQASRVGCRKEYVLQGQDYYYQSPQGDLGRKIKVGVYLGFANTRQDNLGLPLPRGVVRVYKRDGGNNVQFIGEDRIDHTPENETVRLKLGDAFDVTADRKQTDFKKMAGFGRFSNQYESAYQIELKNAKDEETVVKVVEPLPGDWEVVEENLPHRKESAAAAAWMVPVPAKGQAVLTYRVRVRQ
ncbi:MAG: DUF4139 domain-containing protein [Deltaproteobacteria bacterium RIFOXYD12_FULL_57_12]|nr:MAG: DUF4139 domain-containing protein [Deltaproteobacteria bacterium RIFOXYD12_FULL_57_12]